MYIAYSLLDVNGDKRIVQEIASLIGVSYDYNCGCALFVLAEVQDILIPMTEEKFNTLYSGFIEAIKSNSSILEIRGVNAFSNSRDDDDFDYIFAAEETRRSTNYFSEITLAY